MKAYHFISQKEFTKLMAGEPIKPESKSAKGLHIFDEYTQYVKIPPIIDDNISVDIYSIELFDFLYEDSQKTIPFTELDRIIYIPVSKNTLIELSINSEIIQKTQIRGYAGKSVADYLLKEHLIPEYTLKDVTAVYTSTTSFQDPLSFRKHQINDSSNHYIVAKNLSQSWRTDKTLAYIKTAMESNHFLHCTIELTNTPEQTCYNFSLLNHQLMVLVKTFQLKENKPFAIVDKNETVRRQSSYSIMPFLVTDLPI